MKHAGQARAVLFLGLVALAWSLPPLIDFTRSSAMLPVVASVEHVGPASLRYDHRQVLFTYTVDGVS